MRAHCIRLTGHSLLRQKMEPDRRPGPGWADGVLAEGGRVGDVPSPEDVTSRHTFEGAGGEDLTVYECA